MDASSSEPISKRAAVSRVCGICDHEFIGDKSLYEHISSDHVKTWNKGDVCGWKLKNGETCNIYCKARRHYDEHLCTHSGDTRHKCEGFYNDDGSSCVYACAQKGNLLSHIRGHTQERPFVCDGYTQQNGDICVSAFKQKAHLTRHIRTHTGDRPYMCSGYVTELGDACTASFAEGQHLKNHILTHGGQRPYVCSHNGCGKRFTQQTHLKTHVDIVHLGLRRHACSYCTLTFGHKSTVRSHEKCHTVSCFNQCYHSDCALYERLYLLIDSDQMDIL
jgi:hypothetical protein